MKLLESVPHRGFIPLLFQQPDYGTQHQPIQTFPSRGNQWGEDEVGLFYPQQTPDTKYNLHYIHNGWNKNTGFNLYILLCVYLSLIKVKSDWGFWMGMDDIWGIVLVSITAAGLGCFTNIFGWQFYYMEQHWKTSWICIYGPAFLLPCWFNNHISEFRIAMSLTFYSSSNAERRKKFAFTSLLSHVPNCFIPNKLFRKWTRCCFITKCGC